MRTLAPALLGTVLTLAGCMGNGQQAASAEADAGLAKALAGRTAGQSSSCLPPGPTNASTRAYGKVLVYTLGNGDTYVNDTAGGCEQAGRGDVLVSVQYQGRACSGDIIRTVAPYNHIPTGSCALGQFTQYSKPRQ